MQISVNTKEVTAALARISLSSAELKEVHSKEFGKTKIATVAKAARFITEEAGISAASAKARQQTHQNNKRGILEIYVPAKFGIISGAKYKVAISGSDKKLLRNKKRMFVPAVFKGKKGVRFERKLIRVVRGKYTEVLPAELKRGKFGWTHSPHNARKIFIRRAGAVVRDVLPRHGKRVVSRLGRMLKAKAARR